MCRKTIFHWIFTIAVISLVTLIWGMTSTRRVLADCGTPPKSSCISCHTPANHVEVMGEWNSTHLEQDMCTNCHGGNASAADKDLAHVGLAAQPLSDIFTNCHSCHPTDYIARSDQLAAFLNITPGSCATPTAIAVYGGSSGNYNNRIAFPLNNSSGITAWKAIVMIAAALASLMVFLLGLGWLVSHRLKG